MRPEEDISCCHPAIPVPDPSARSFGVPCSTNAAASSAAIVAQTVTGSSTDSSAAFELGMFLSYASHLHACTPRAFFSHQSRAPAYQNSLLPNTAIRSSHSVFSVSYILVSQFHIAYSRARVSRAFGFRLPSWPRPPYGLHWAPWLRQSSARGSTIDPPSFFGTPLAL